MCFHWSLRQQGESVQRGPSIRVFVGVHFLGIPRFSAHILRTIHVTMVCTQCVGRNISIHSPEVQMVFGKGRHGVNQCTKDYNVIRISWGRKGGGYRNIDGHFRPYGSIMEGVNALYSRSPPTAVASTASTAATIKPARWFSFGVRRGRLTHHRCAFLPRDSRGVL